VGVTRRRRPYRSDLERATSAWERSGYNPQLEPDWPADMYDDGPVAPAAHVGRHEYAARWEVVTPTVDAPTGLLLWPYCTCGRWAAERPGFDQHTEWHEHIRVELGAAA
jgi:hypothetical protein